MRLKPDAKLSRNLKLLHACSQVRVIELTEKLSTLDKKQVKLINSSPKLKAFLTNVHQENHKNDPVYIVNPSAIQLVETDLSNYQDFEPDEEFAEVFHKYADLYNKINNMKQTLDEHQDLNELLSQRTVPLNELHKFLNKSTNSKTFKQFADIVKEVPAIIVALKFKHTANRIAERNGIADATYYSKSDKAFSINDVVLKLNQDVRGRVLRPVAGVLTTATVASSVFGFGYFKGQDSIEHTQGQTTQHTIQTEVSTTETPSTLTPEETKEDLNIFTNSISTLTSYETACDAYFEAIEDVYEYNTGKEIDLSGYGQEHIGINNSAPILEVEYNGQTYRFSGQSQTASNYRHLKEAFDALGADYTETSSRILYIVDKDNSSQSIAIVDSLGNPVRSGNVITGSNRAYNQEYVREGREILAAQGKDASSLSEAECVAAYLLSDEYDIQDPDLSIAQGHFASSTYTIKTTFFYDRDGKSDQYAVQAFAGDLRDDKATFEHSVSTQNIQANEQTTDDKEHDDR